MRNGERLHHAAPLFSDVADAFLTHVEQQAEVAIGTRKNYADKWSLLKTHFEDVKVTDVTTRFLLTLRDHL